MESALWYGSAPTGTGLLLFESDTYTAIQCFPSLILIIGLFWLPESPRWLMLKDRNEEARTILLKLHAPEEAAIEIAQIEAQAALDRTLPSSYWAMFTKPSYRKRCGIAIFVMAAIQCSGVLVINSESFLLSVYHFMADPRHSPIRLRTYGELSFRRRIEPMCLNT